MTDEKIDLQTRILSCRKEDRVGTFTVAAVAVLKPDKSLSKDKKIQHADYCLQRMHDTLDRCHRIMIDEINFDPVRSFADCGLKPETDKGE